MYGFINYVHLNSNIIPEIELLEVTKTHFPLQ